MELDTVYFLRKRFKNKDTLINFCKDKLSLHIPRESSYNKIVDLISQDNNEKDFCKFFYNTNNFKDLISKYVLMQGLNTFSKEELILICDEVGKNHIEWKYKKNRVEDVISFLLEKASNEEIITTLEKLISEKKIPDVKQYGEWVIGPLGVLKSITRRTSTESEDIIKFLKKHTNYQIYQKVKETTNIFDGIVISDDDKTFIPKFLQLLLAHMDSESTFRLLNQFIDQGSLKIDAIEQYWDFIATPCGVFRKVDTEPIEELAEILLIGFEEEELCIELQRENCFSTDVKLAIAEWCLKENPDKIFDNLFGFPDLRQIAKGMGLVAIQEVQQKSDLIKMILLKMGFDVPLILEGINKFSTVLEVHEKQLESLQLDDVKLVGVMTTAYVETEAVLKDLAYFYISFFWEEKIRNIYEREEKVEEINKILKEIFKCRNIDSLTFGGLLELLKRINKKVIEDEKLKEKMKKIFNRSYVFSDNQIENLNFVHKYRASFTHDKRVDVDHLTCKKIISRLINLSRSFRDEQVYPLLLRLKREIKSEYGITSLEMIDEFGDNWIIKTNKWIQSEYAYFIHSKTKHVAINPTIVERFW